MHAHFISNNLLLLLIFYSKTCQFNYKNQIIISLFLLLSIFHERSTIPIFYALVHLYVHTIIGRDFSYMVHFFFYFYMVLPIDTQKRLIGTIHENTVNSSLGFKCLASKGGDKAIQ